MSKGSRRTIPKGATPGRGRKSRKKRPITRYPATVASRRISDQEGAFSTRPTSHTQQIAPPQSHVFSDLKRIGIIAVAMIAILVILYIIL